MIQIAQTCKATTALNTNTQFNTTSFIEYDNIQFVTISLVTTQSTIPTSILPLVYIEIRSWLSGTLKTSYQIPSISPISMSYVRSTQKIYIMYKSKQISFLSMDLFSGISTAYGKVISNDINNDKSQLSAIISGLSCVDEISNYFYFVSVLYDNNMKALSYEIKGISLSDMLLNPTPIIKVNGNIPNNVGNEKNIESAQPSTTTEWNSSVSLVENTM